MASADEDRTHRVDDGVLEFFSILARYLLEAGVSLPRLSSLVRVAYFNAAVDLSRFNNERVNQSAIAAMTGLTRVEVRKYAKQKTPSPQKARDRLDNLIEGWSSDTAFTNSSDQPKRLRLVGPGKTFPALVRKYGGDIPPRAVLRELQRKDYVNVRDGFVSLRAKASHNREEARLRRVMAALSDLIRASTSAMPSTTLLRSLVAETSYPAVSEKARVLMQKRATDGLSAFLAALEAAGTSAASDMPPHARRKGRVTRVRVVMVSEDLV